MSPDDELIIRRAAYEAAAFGDAEIVGEEDRKHVFKETDEGRERVRQFIDDLYETHGDDAGEAIAEALGVATEVGEQLVYVRLRERLG